MFPITYFPPHYFPSEFFVDSGATVGGGSLKGRGSTLSLLGGRGTTRALLDHVDLTVPLMGSRSVAPWVPPPVAVFVPPGDLLPMRSILDIDPDIIADGETDVTSRVNTALGVALANSWTVYFPEGDYVFSGQIANLTAAHTLGLIGDGRERTRFLATDDFGDDPLINVSGGGDMQHGLLVSGIGFDSVSGEDLDWLPFNLEYAIYTRFYNLLFRNIDRTAIQGTVWWDAILYGCDFASGGTTDVPMVWLKDAIDPVGSNNCNNIIFDRCRFEFCSGIAIKFGDNSRNNAILRCKIEGGNKGLVYDNSTRNEIRGGHFTHLGDDAISGTDGEAFDITGVLFEGNGGWAINGELNYSTVHHNRAGYGGANSDGDFNIDGDFNEVYNNVLLS